MTSDSGGRERRRWPRAPLGGEVVGHIYTEHAAPILDLSEGGALIEVPCALRPRSVYSVRLVIGPGTVLMLKASVVRSYVHHFEYAGKGETRVRYQAALQFVDLRAADQRLLRRRIAGEAPLFAAALTDIGQTTDGEPPVERRDFMRVDLEGALAGEVGLHLESRVLMLSPGGMTVRMPFCPELGSIVTCTLEGDGVPAQVRGTVRDTHQEEPESERLDFIVGLEFIDVQEEARMRIEAYLDRKAQAGVWHRGDGTEHPLRGELVDLVATGKEREALLAEANTLPSLQISDRSVHDLELLAVGAFSPLRGFMGQADYEGVLREMRLANGTLRPLPITLPVADAPVQPGASVTLRNSKNELLAVMRVAEVYPWDYEREATVMAGKPDPRHPLVAES